MMNDSFIRAARQIEILLENCPNQTASLLGKLYRDEPGIKSEIDSILYLWETARQNTSRSSRSTATIPDRARGHERSSSSQCSTSLTRRHTSTLSDDYSTPLSPRSTGSHSTRASFNSGEYILIIDVTEDSEEQPVRMKTAPIEHSLIREDIARRRIKSTAPIEEDKFQTLALTRSDPDTFEEVPVSESIELTWRRKRSNATHRTKFFLVPEDLLETDVILGVEDSQGYKPGVPVQVTLTSRPQQPQGYMDEMRHQDVRLPAPTPHPAMYDRSYHRSDSPTRHSAHSSGPQRPERHAAQPISPGLRAGQHQYTPYLPATASRDNSSSRAQHSQSHRAPPGPTMPTSNRNFDASERRMRLKLKWDVTTFNVWLDMDGPAEAFFLALQQQVSKRRAILDRTLMTIYLKPQEQSQDVIALPLSLGPDELDADWTETVEWLEVNKQDRPPHIYGTIKVDEG